MARLALPRTSRWEQRPWNRLFSGPVSGALWVLVGVLTVGPRLLWPAERAWALVYGAPWFVVLVGLAALHAAAMARRAWTLGRLRTLRTPVERPPEFYTEAPAAQSFPGPARSEALADALRRLGYDVRLSGAHGYGVRERAARRCGPLLWAASSLLGVALIVWSLGYRHGTLRVGEGERSRALVLSVSPETRIVDPGFSVVCVDFASGDTPEQQPDPAAADVALRVEWPTGRSRDLRLRGAAPVGVGGWTLRLRSVHYVAEMERYRLRIAPPPDADLPSTITLELSPGQSRPLTADPAGPRLTLEPGTPLAWAVEGGGTPLASGSVAGGGRPVLVRVEQYEPDFYVDTDGRGASRSSQPADPAIRLAVYDNRVMIDNVWLPLRDDSKREHEALAETRGPYRFELMRIQGDGSQRRFIVDVRNRDGGLVRTAELAMNELTEIAAPEIAVPDERARGWRVAVERRVPAYVVVLELTRNPARGVLALSVAVALAGLGAGLIPRREVWFKIDARRPAVLAVAAVRGRMGVWDHAARAALARGVEGSASGSAPS